MAAEGTIGLDFDFFDLEIEKLGPGGHLHEVQDGRSEDGLDGPVAALARSQPKLHPVETDDAPKATGVDAKSS